MVLQTTCAVSRSFHWRIHSKRCNRIHLATTILIIRRVRGIPNLSKRHLLKVSGLILIDSSSERTRKQLFFGSCPDKYVVKAGGGAGVHQTHPMYKPNVKDESFLFARNSNYSGAGNIQNGKEPLLSVNQAYSLARSRIMLRSFDIAVISTGGD